MQVGQPAGAMMTRAASPGSPRRRRSHPQVRRVICHAGYWRDMPWFFCKPLQNRPKTQELATL